MDLWLSLITAEPKNENQKKEKTNKSRKLYIEELAACDISGIDLLDDVERKESIDQTNDKFK